MNSEDIRKSTFRIGAFRIEPTRNLMKKDGQSFALEPRIMDVLCELASYPGEVIPRFELIKRIWKVDYGADESLTRAISVLRKTFRKGGADEKYIETISKNGYRLIAHVGSWDRPINRIVTAVPEAAPSAVPIPTVSEKSDIESLTPTDAPRVASPSVPALTPASVPAPVTPGHAPTAALPPVKPAPVVDEKSDTGVSSSTIWLIAAVVTFIFTYFGGAFMDKDENTPKVPVAQSAPSTPLDESTAAEGTSVRQPSQSAAEEAARQAAALDPNFRIKKLNTGLVFGNSVAVLSFSDMSIAGDQEYFADGMAEELLTQLASIENLRVVSRQASFAYKGKGVDPREIGQRLQVSHILGGSVRTNGELVRVSIQLISADDANQIWSKSYNGRLEDGFDIQEKIARETADELRFILTPISELNVPTKLEPSMSTQSFDPSQEEIDDAWFPNGPPQ